MQQKEIGVKDAQKMMERARWALLVLEGPEMFICFEKMKAAGLMPNQRSRAEDASAAGHDACHQQEIRAPP